MTIMTETRGGVTRRCDARCHTARTPRCGCICGVRYHGVGSSQAAQALLARDLAGMPPLQAAREPGGERGE
jgi:hypothetical protein